MPIDEPQHVRRCSGRGRTRSPRKTALRPSGWRDGDSRRRRRADLVAELAEQLAQLVAAAVDVADDVERPVLARCGRSRAAARSIVAASTSSGVESTKTWRKPSRSRPRSDRRSCCACWRTTCGPKSRSGAAAVALLADLLRAGRGRWRRAGSGTRGPAATSGLRASGCTLVASTTVSRPAARRLRGDEVQHLEGVARSPLWSFSSSATSPRQKSDESTSVGWKCLRGEGGLAASRTGRSARRGRARGSHRSSCLHRPARRPPSASARRPPASSAPTGTKRDARSRTARRRRSAQPANSARVHSKRWSRWRSVARGQTLEATLYSTFGVVRTTVAGPRATRTARARTRPRRGGSRCSMTSTTAAASKPARGASR